ncbi:MULTISPECIES: SDR family oxidoreductase [unclassified Curtobacterium]|uniref:SDR family oxidoreductase n=1 Tax=unclassified Curtobacterium TaxID=257496 RepID=UPI000DA81F1E|nr:MULTISPECIES: SDR family oxidoreductase [unclassified Curtobacterium]PZE28899.1 oxidoreductase [Curtobacterium sp. MCBD17_028]PZE77250.1 oxidoreductase [Curtobacterium sp. MCBD17_019]PZF57594.1 oxidoreductase [Curtobacterium sp. MCBD17_034]PZF65280.1 oxidoreductase [Curtobacterium sp. MCBD17_013]PZM33686.1 oxidoreductase [Curtobacterium sp. MCBD17_031]
MAARRAVVTGASSGIGAATVRLFRAHGWEVVAVARREDRLTALAEETDCEAFVADVTDASAVAALAARVGELGGVDALVNNAGGAFGLEPVETSSVDDWRAMFEVNVIGTKQVTSALLPHLRTRADVTGGADVVTVTSTAATVPYEGGAGYNAAKAAEHALVAVLRLELSGEPIRVVEIAPGMVRTEEFSLVRFGGDQDRADAVYQGVADPLVAEDVAAAIVHAVELPAHVNLDLVTIKPVAQSAQHKVARGELRTR